jgi:hypothetical protein
MKKRFEAQGRRIMKIDRFFDYIGDLRKVLRLSMDMKQVVLKT